MPKLPHCDFCQNDIPMSATVCPHCGRPGLYPNVRAAEDRDEVMTLEIRYQAAVADAAGRSAGHALQDFKSEIGDSKAVIARSASELQRLANSDRGIYATYYEV